jgi:hypothetical protein
MDQPQALSGMKLPVSGLGVAFRVPDGRDDLAILEAPGGVLQRALRVLPRLAPVAGGSTAEKTVAPWAELTVTDFEAALLGLRRFLFGDRIACTFRCPGARCGDCIEPEFSITAFLDDVKPTAPERVASSPERAGWFTLAAAGGDVLFRLPAVEDQIHVLGRPHAARLLAGRCIEGKKLNAREVARVERAMEAMAPPVSRPLAGNCPECGEPANMPLHVPRLVMEELRISATGVHAEIHAIARAYHWGEAAILEMPQMRRRAYAESIRREKVAS